MSDAASDDDPVRDLPTLILPGAGLDDDARERDGEGIEPVEEDAISSPAKVMRIGAMTKQLLEEVRRAPLDEAGRTRLRDIYETSVRELGECLSSDLRDELARLSSPFESATPSDAELRVAQAQLVGWLEGLFHGIQAALFTQQMAAQAQLEEMRRRGLPPGAGGHGGPPELSRPGQYL